MKKITMVVVLIALSVLTLSAQITWNADKAHSKVNFSVTHMVISEVTGTFRDFDVTLVAAKDDFSDAKIDATIKTASISTDNEGRDNHLKSDDFFNAEKFPDMKFKSTKIERTGDKTFNVAGDLTIRDITKPVVLAMKYNGQVTDARGNTKAGFKATTTIDRFEFGTKWNKVIEAGSLVVGKNVDITLLLEFNKQSPEKGK
jgi:polyisoprenoid-binding protein YceI